jgi:phosphomannomutase
MIMPKLQVTGYRGIWGESLDAKIAYEYARAFAKFIRSKGGKKVLVGRDARPSGPEIFGSVLEAFTKEGIEVVNADIIPTPSVLLLVKKLEYDGGVMITASHNPPEYNGIKFVVAGGRLTNAEEVLAIENFRNNLTPEEKLPSPGAGLVTRVDNSAFRKIHIDEILKNIDVDLIKSKKFKITLDVINGAGAVIAPELLEELGCEVKIINEAQDGSFAHTPEPLAENLSQIMEEARKNKSNIGFALDPDADRLATVDDNGQYITEEHTLVLIIKNILEKVPTDIVINAQTSNMSEDVAKKYGRKTHRSKVGEANVLSKMMEIGAKIGGEGGGGVIYPTINASRDGLVCMALILELMARENKKISEIIQGLPKYYMMKEKVPVAGNIQELYDNLKKEFSDARLNEQDGDRFDWADSSWLCIRPSLTEPIIRIYGEAKTPERINSLFDRARLTLSAK